MRINFERLRDAGFHVAPDKDGVDIVGTREFPFAEARTFLLRFDLTESQQDQMLGEMASQIELHQIFNALR